MNPDRNDKIVRGIICIILSGLCFSLMNVAIRTAGDIPSMQKCVFRNSIALILAIGTKVDAGYDYLFKTVLREELSLFDAGILRS